jgi:hypothetical protein
MSPCKIQKQQVAVVIGPTIVRILIQLRLDFAICTCRNDLI